MASGSLHRASEDVRLDHLKEQHELMLNDARERGKKWSGHRDEYAKLKERLKGLPDRATVEAMVPLGKKAFMAGHLVHTNEIMVLLGDNWFAERSAKQATEICQRRMDKCDDTISGLKKEIGLIEGWKKGTDMTGRGAKSGEEEEVEIREMFDEKYEEEWREKHRERVREERGKDKTIIQPAKDVDDIWRRLDELEIEEELDEHLECDEDEDEGDDEKGVKEDRSDWSESPGLSDDEDEEEEEGKPKVPKRRVSFAAAEDVSQDESKVAQQDLNEPICLIEIKHSSDPSRLRPSNSKSEAFDHASSDPSRLRPSDLDSLVQQKSLEQEPRRRRRSILKPFDASDIQVRSIEASEFKSETGFAAAVREPFIDPIADQVVEREVVAALPMEPFLPAADSTKKVSKFKQSRAGKK